MSGTFVNVGSLQRHGQRNGSLSRNLLAANPLLRASWLLFDRQGNLSPLVTSSRTTEGTYVDSLGILRIAPAGVPRASYDPAALGAGPHLLADETRTNICIWSEEFNDPAWTKDAAISVTANDLVSPAGVLTADTVSHDGSATFRAVRRVIASTALLPHTSSCFFKAGTLSTVSLGLFFSNASNGGRAIFNLVTGEITGMGALGTAIQSSDVKASFERFGGGWVRCSLTVNPTAIGSITSAIPYFYPGTLNAQVAGNLGMWGAQVEVGNSPSSYIPTAGSPVTRGADSLSLTNLAATGFSVTEGTLYIDAEEKSDTLSTKLALSLTDGGNNDIYSLATFNNTFRIRAANFSSSGIGSTTPGRRFRGVLAYSPGLQRGAVTGGAFGTLAQTVTQTPTIMRIGSNQAANSFWNSRIYQAAIIPTRVPDRGLQRMVLF